MDKQEAALTNTPTNSQIEQKSVMRIQSLHSFNYLVNSSTQDNTKVSVYAPGSIGFDLDIGEFANTTCTQRAQTGAAVPTAKSQIAMSVNCTALRRDEVTHIVSQLTSAGRLSGRPTTLITSPND